MIETENDEIETEIKTILKCLRIPIDKMQVFPIRSMAQDQMIQLIRISILEHSLRTKLLIMNLPIFESVESSYLQNHLEYITEGISRVL